MTGAARTSASRPVVSFRASRWPDRISSRAVREGNFQSGADAENQGDRAECYRVKRRDAEELRLDEAAEDERRREAEKDSGERQSERTTDDHPHDIARQRAERHTNTDLAGPLRDRVAHDAEDTRRREHERDGGKQREKARVEPGRAIERTTSCVIGVMSAIARSGSSARISPRIAPATAAGSPAVRTTSLTERIVRCANGT